MNKPTRGKISRKPYKCRECGTVEDHDTNHWGAIYPFCRKCRRITIWDCLQKCPEGFDIPEEWKIVKLGDVAEIF